MSALKNPPFSKVPLLGGRISKPRKTGLTMMMDWGVGFERLRDHLDLVGPYVDLIKIVVGTARLYEAENLVRKLEMIKSYDVAPFIGGQFTEYVYKTQGMSGIPDFFAEAKSLGFEAIEVSDNCVPLDDDTRRALIVAGVDAGLDVHGEVGSKVEQQNAADLIRQARICLDAGCHVVLVEGAELAPRGEPDRELIRTIKSELGLEKVLFELTGPWIKGVNPGDVYQLKTFLVQEFGTNVNLANVMPDDVLETEALRVGLSVAGPDLIGAGAK